MWRFLLPSANRAREQWKTVRVSLWLIKSHITASLKWNISVCVVVKISQLSWQRLRWLWYEKLRLFFFFSLTLSDVWWRSLASVATGSQNMANEYHQRHCQHQRYIQLTNPTVNAVGWSADSTESHCLTSRCCYQLPTAGMTAMQKLFNSRPMGSLRQAADSTHLMPAPKCCQSAKGTFNIAVPYRLKIQLSYF